MSKGMLFKPDVWKGKQEALDKYGEAVTRRCEKSLEEINKEPDLWIFSGVSDGIFHFDLKEANAKYPHNLQRIKPRYHVGETVYVKEAWRVDKYYDGRPPREIPEGVVIECRIQPHAIITEGDGHRALTFDPGRWRSPLFMPEWASRCKLTILEVGTELFKPLRLSDEEYAKEGGNAALERLMLMNGKWVFRYRFKREGK